MSRFFETTGGVACAHDAVTDRRCVLAAENEKVCIGCLLQAILDLFQQQNVDRLRSSDIVSAGLGIDSQGLANRLRPVFIRPAQMKFKGRNWRGYRRQWFENALTRFSDIHACRGQS